VYCVLGVFVDLQPVAPSLRRERHRRRLFDGLGVEKGAGPIGGPFNVWLRRPEPANLLQQVGSQVRFKSSPPARLNALAILVTARHWTTQNEWFAHRRLALAAGLDPQVASDLASGLRPANMHPDEALVHDFPHELHTTHGVSEATYAAVVERFGEAGAMDLIAVNGYYTLVSMTLNVDRSPLPVGRRRRWRRLRPASGCA